MEFEETESLERAPRVEGEAHTCAWQKILIKVVAQAIPTNTANKFQLPDELIEEIYFTSVLTGLKQDHEKIC